MADLINGFGGPAGFGELALQASSGGSLLVKDISSVFEFGLILGGEIYDQLRISTNGGVSFGDGFAGLYRPIKDTSAPGLYPFLDNVDTRSGPQDATPSGTSTGSNTVYYHFDTNNDRIVITWDDVGRYFQNVDNLNAFQVIISDVGIGDIDVEFRYEDINWARLYTSASAGYVAGPGATTPSFSLPGSGDQAAMLALEETLGNTGEAGRWLFEFRSDLTLGPPSAGNDLTFGTAGDDSIDPLAGDDLVLAGDGDDVVFASLGTDSLTGGAGTDTFSFANATEAIDISFRQWTTIETAEFGLDTLSGFEILIGTDFDDIIADGTGGIIFGGAGNDQLVSNGSTRALFGEDGNDRLVGSLEGDTLIGGAGDDTMIGRSGGNVMRGGEGNDFLSISWFSNGISRMYGDAGADRLAGGGATQIMYGGAGDDKLTGGNGDDELFGNGGTDAMLGGADSDTLHGGAGLDYLLGGAGSDILNGGAGDDRLTGGAGGGQRDFNVDVFVFEDLASGGGGFDRVKDFEDGIDLLDLTAFGFTAFADVLALAEDRAHGLRIGFDVGEVIYLFDMSLAQFDASDVLL